MSGESGRAPRPRQFLPGIFSSLPSFFADPNVRFFMIGVLIVAVIMLRPGGILGEERRMARSPTPEEV